MAWFHDSERSTFVRVYKNEKEMQRDVEDAAEHGWIPQALAGTPGHINAGRTVTRAFVTGGYGLLLGASRSKDKITITFIRDDRWEARRLLRETMRAANDELRRIEDRRKDLDRHLASYQNALEILGQSSQWEQVEAERELLRALNNLVEVLGWIIDRAEGAQSALLRARDAYESTRNLGLDVSDIVATDPAARLEQFNS